MVCYNELLGSSTANMDFSPDVSDDLIRESLLLLIGIMTSGAEIQPTMPQAICLSGFSMPKPVGRGTSIRNVEAFRILFTTFSMVI